MNKIIEKMLDILNICKEKGLKGYAEIDDLEETSLYAIDVEGLKFAECFTFYWKKGEALIHYSALYEIEEERSIDSNIYARLEYPFNKISLNKDRSGIEIEGYIKEEDFTNQVIGQILDYVMKGHNILEEISKISKHIEFNETECKKKCDMNLYKVCHFYIDYGVGGINDILHRIEIPLSEIKASIKTLSHIGIIKEDEDFQYELVDQNIVNAKEQKELINHLNKEIKKHER